MMPNMQVFDILGRYDAVQIVKYAIHCPQDVIPDTQAILSVHQSNGEYGDALLLSKDNLM